MAIKYATGAGYVGICRTLLQDTVQPYRYSDPEFLQALNLGLSDAWRIRYDFFLGLEGPPLYTDLTQTVKFPNGYETALVYYMCGHIQLRDDEVNVDQRAASFLARFQATLLSLQ